MIDDIYKDNKVEIQEYLFNKFIWIIRKKLLKFFVCSFISLVIKIIFLQRPYGVDIDFYNSLPFLFPSEWPIGCNSICPKG